MSNASAAKSSTIAPSRAPSRDQADGYGLASAARPHSLREYRTFAEIGRMIARTAFTQLHYSPWLLLGAIAGLILTYLVPPLITLLAPQGPARAVGAAAWLLMTAAYAPAVRYYRLPWFWVPLLPAIAAFYLGATVWSAISYWMGRGGMWKGRAAASTNQAAQ